VISRPAVPVDDALVREAVGAGDAFDAGFLDALIRGHDAAGAARWGTATASLSLTGRGGAEGIADRAAVEARLRVVPAAVTTAGIGR
jgi:ribokinase